MHPTQTNNSFPKDDKMSSYPPVMEEVKEDIYDSSILTTSEEKALIRRVDMRLMPLMFTSYLLQFLDKTALGYTAIMGILDDINLQGSQYSWVSSVFYLGYLVASGVAALCFVKFPLGKFLAITVAIWGVILACHGAASNFAGLLTLRIMLGVFESTISPGFSLVTGLFYKPSEHASRHGVWFAGNSIASLFGGLLAYGISHITSPVAAWRWLFIIFGITTFVWGVVLYFFLPDSPLTARFLNSSQQRYIYHRAQQSTHSYKTKEWKRAQVVEALKDPKTWCLFVYTVATSFPNAGITNFGSIIIKGFGFDLFTTLLLNMPGAFFLLFFVIVSSTLASYLRKSRCLIIATLQIVSLIGVLLINQLPASLKWGRMAGIWLFPAYAAGFPLSLSLIASDVQGYTKKTTVSAILFIGYCAGNMAGPQLFLANEAPGYRSAFLAIYVALALAVVAILGMRLLMDRENKRRDREQGVVINPEAKVAEGEEVERVRTGVDETDWENRGFRYFL